MMEEDLSVLERRNFFLALSITDGQQLAHLNGFAVPSEEVQKSEIIEIIAKWLLLASHDVVRQSVNCSDWFITSSQMFRQLPEHEVEAARMMLASYGVAFAIHLLDKGLIDITSDPIAANAPETSSIRDLLKRFMAGE